MDVYVALRSSPDSSHSALVSIHQNLDRAIHALYPDREDFRAKFIKRAEDRWTGPDGFGEVRKMPVK